jgi:hypothetical protein
VGSHNRGRTMPRIRTSAAFTMLVIGGLLSGTAAADEGDGTLRSYLAHAEVVLDATVEELDGPVHHELGVAHYLPEVRIHAVIKGAVADAKEPLRVEIVRFEMEEADALPYLKKGARVVLFLRAQKPGHTPALVTADMWSGVQPYGPWLVRRLVALQQPPATPKAVEWTAVAQASSRDVDALETVFALLDRAKIESLGIGSAGADTVSVPKADAARARKALRDALGSDEARRARDEAEKAGQEDPPAWRFRVVE